MPIEGDPLGQEGDRMNVDRDASTRRKGTRRPGRSRDGWLLLGGSLFWTIAGVISISKGYASGLAFGGLLILLGLVGGIASLRMHM